MLSIQLFGKFQAQVNGKTIDAFPTRKARDLLAYLALYHDVAHARDRIADLLWSDSDEERARRCLNTTLWRLQSVLRSCRSKSADAPFIHVTSRSLTLDTTRGTQVDVAQFEQLLTLPGRLIVRNSERHSVREQRTSTWVSYCLTATTIGLKTPVNGSSCNTSTCSRACWRTIRRTTTTRRRFGAASRILVCDPLREQVHRRLIELHLANDEPALALKQYSSCVRALQAELQVEPSRETQALLPRIMAALPRGSAEPLNSTARADLHSTAIRLREAAAACEQARMVLIEAASALAAVTASPIGR